MTEREELAQQSAQALAKFVCNHPDYSIDKEQPEYRGGTNLITYGHRRTQAGEQQPIVYKYFIRTYRYSQEYFCLCHFRETGHVPKVLAVVPERLIVMTRLADSDGRLLTLSQRTQVSYEIGQAVGALVLWPLPAAGNRPNPRTEFEHFAWRTDVGEIIKDVLVCCRQIQKNMSAYQTPLYTEALKLAEEHVAYIDQQPRILFHEDIPNLCVHGGHFQGFYDLEMARIGTEAHQLGVALDLCRPHWMDGEWLVWSDFIRGYQETTGRTLGETDFLSILAMSHFYYHLRLSRWGKWDGNSAQVENMNFATSNAADYHEYMKRACYSMQDWIDLYKWFPSLR